MYYKNIKQAILNVEVVNMKKVVPNNVRCKDKAISLFTKKPTYLLFSWLGGLQLLKPPTKLNLSMC